MTNKEQIIIDGVDVSGCKCYNKNIKTDCLLYPLQPDACKNNPNCYFKQLARTKKELASTKGLVTVGARQLKEAQEVYNELKQECEELKRENNNLRQMYESMAELCGIKDEAIIDKQVDIEELKEDLKRYKRVLKDTVVTKIDYLQESLTNQIKADHYRKALGRIQKLAKGIITNDPPDCAFDEKCPLSDGA